MNARQRRKQKKVLVGLYPRIASAFEHAATLVEQESPQEAARQLREIAAELRKGEITPVGYVSHDAYRGAMDRAYIAERQARLVSENMRAACLDICNEPMQGNEPSGFAWTRRHIKQKIQAIPAIIVEKG